MLLDLTNFNKLDYLSGCTDEYSWVKREESATDLSPPFDSRKPSQFEHAEYRTICQYAIGIIRIVQGAVEPEDMTQGIKVASRSLSNQQLVSNVKYQPSSWHTRICQHTSLDVHRETLQPTICSTDIVTDELSCFSLSH